MRARPAFASLLVAAVLVVPPALAAGHTPAGAGVRVAACSVETRSAAFQARMQWIEDSAQMWMRFRLLERGAGGFHVVRTPGLGRWRRSRLGVGTFAYRQGVRALRPGAVYRMVVGFRWYGADGALLQTARRRSPVCSQFDALPNLVVHVVDAEGGLSAGVLRYHVRVANVGPAAASSVPIRLLVDGSVVDTVTVGSLRSGQRRWLTVLGPDCTRSVEAVADPDDLIVESSEGDNAHTRACDELPRG